MIKKTFSHTKITFLDILIIRHKEKFKNEMRRKKTYLKNHTIKPNTNTQLLTQ